MSITNLKLNKIILEELENERYSIIYNQECQRIDRLHEEIDRERRLLTEAYFGVPEWMVHLGLDVIGFIPFVGAPADLTNAYLYATKKEYLMAALSVISVIPAFGDVIALSGKAVVKLGAKAATEATKVGRLITKNWKSIEKVFKGLEKTPLIGKYVPQMKIALAKLGKRSVLQPTAAAVKADAAMFRNLKSSEALGKRALSGVDEVADVLGVGTAAAAGKAAMAGVKAGHTAKGIGKAAAAAAGKSVLGILNPMKRLRAYKEAYLNYGLKYFGREKIPAWFFKTFEKDAARRLAKAGQVTLRTTGYGRVIPGFGKAYKVGMGGGKGLFRAAIGKVAQRELVRYGPLGWPGHIYNYVTGTGPFTGREEDREGPSAEEWKEMVEKGTAQAWCKKNPEFDCYYK